MACIRDLRKRRKTVDVDGEQITVYALSIGKILDILDKRAGFSEAFRAPEAERVQALTRAIIACGSDAINEIIDTGTKEPAGTAAEADLDAGAELQLLMGIVDVSLDEKMVGKLKAEAVRVGARFGLANEGAA